MMRQRVWGRGSDMHTLDRMDGESLIYICLIVNTLGETRPLNPLAINKMALFIQCSKGAESKTAFQRRFDNYFTRNVKK